MTDEQAWEAYLNEQKQIIGMPGLMAKPSFIAGYRAALATPAPLSDEPVALTEADVERQYHNGVHIGSGLPRATCPCGFCAKHRHGFNLATPSDKREAKQPFGHVYEYKRGKYWFVNHGDTTQEGTELIPVYIAQSAEQDRIDAERYRKWVSYSGFTKEKCDETLDATQINEHAAKEPK